MTPGATDCLSRRRGALSAHSALKEATTPLARDANPIAEPSPQQALEAQAGRSPKGSTIPLKSEHAPHPYYAKATMQHGQNLSPVQ